MIIDYNHQNFTIIACEPSRDLELLMVKANGFGFWGSIYSTNFENLCLIGGSLAAVL
jgi:hypothetical protein